MIESFRCKDTAALFANECPKRFRAIRDVATRRLAAMDAASELRDLRSPPGNRLEALRGDRASQYSIRINDQWRICFVWTEGGPADVAIVDYHH
jgi:proteic killer suppression protein